LHEQEFACVREIHVTKQEDSVRAQGHSVMAAAPAYWNNLQDPIRR
jgi:hypothetical protein